MIFLRNDDGSYRYVGICVAMKAPLKTFPCEARIFVASQNPYMMGFLWYGLQDKETILVCPE